MISCGERAPSFALPAVVDGEIEQVSLEDYLGEDIVILAFYPADFNPACADGTTDLDELDLFTMQKDVSILGISGDSVHSHRAFAAEYDLHIPLLADVDGRVTAEYGVAVADPDAGYLSERAVVVIDPGGEVQYVWRTDALEELPPVEEVRSAVEGIGGGDTAEARYRVGHAHYVEGRRTFTSAMHEFEEMEWMLAQGDFTQAYEEFEEAADHFNTAVRFAEDETALTYYERAEQKAEALWQAAEWLADAASAFASGEGAEGQSMRRDAETPLETARDIHEPPDPDEFPPAEDPAELDEEETPTILPSDEDDETPSLNVDLTDIDDEIAGTGESTSDSESDTPATDDGDRSPSVDPVAGSGMTATDENAPTTDHGSEPSADDEATVVEKTGDEVDNDEETGDEETDEVEEIDEAELEEITAELEAQTKQAQEEFEDEPREPESVVPDDPSSIIDDDQESTTGEEPTPTEGQSDDPPDEHDPDGDDEENLELDLTDPTEEPDDSGDEDGEEDNEVGEGDDKENEDEDGDDEDGDGDDNEHDGDDSGDDGDSGEDEHSAGDLGSGSHGVPDSL